MILWIIAITLTIVFLALLVLIWIRKLQFDAVHRNFLDLEDKFGGKVVRGGFAVRPRYTGTYQGQKISISITYENARDGRKYYIAATMQAASQINFTIMSTEWLEHREIPKDDKRTTVSIIDNQYIIEVPNKKLLEGLNISQIEAAVRQLDKFAYILAAKTGIILERISTNIVTDTQLESLQALVEGLYQLKLAVE